MNKRIILYAVLLAILMMAVSYVCTNQDEALSGEKEVLKYWNAITSFFSRKDKNDVPDDVLFINVSTDKQLVDLTDEEFNIPIGNAAITDREKLVDLLTLIQSSGNYAYVMMDVIFEEGYFTDADSTLFDLIASMDRVVIPRHADAKLASPVLETKAAYADYATSLSEDNFTKYPLMDKTGTVSSMPLKVYTDLTGRTIKKQGLLYTDKAALSRRVVFPKMYVLIDSPYSDSGEKTYYNMGADILAAYMDVDDQKELFENKIIVIGSFTDDLHTTYAGEVAGCVINYNVLLSLLKGQHKMPWVLVLVYFLIFFAMSCLLLNSASDKTQSWGWIWAKLFVIYSVVLTVVCIFVFMIWGQAHDIFITSTLFSIIDACYKKINKKESHA